MFRRRLTFLLAALLLLLVLACGAGPEPTPTATPTPSPFPLTVTGSNGAKVFLQRPPERIIAFDSAAVEILFALGQGRRVAGTHTYVTYPPEVEMVPKVGDAFNVNFEAIAQLKPDLVYIFFDRFVPDLEKLGVPVLYVKSPATFEDVKYQMRLWGQIVGEPAAGESIAAAFEAKLAQFRGKVAGVTTPPKVYIDVSPMLWTLGSGSLADEFLKLLKAQNVFSDVSGAKQVSGEEIVARAPDVIVSTYPGGGDQFKGDPALSSLPAVQKGRLCEIDGSLVSAPGPRLIDGIEAVGKCIYPERFP
jgi:iron complex transport system substrate-binding protein